MTGAAMVDWFNLGVGRVLDLMLLPFHGIDPVWGLVMLSIASGLVLLWCYGKLSNQVGLKRTKQKIFGCILEAVIYRQDLRTSLGAQGRMFRYGFSYLRYALVPIIVLMVPCIVLLAHLNERYNYRGLEIGQRTLLKVQVDPAVIEQVELRTSQGIEATPPVRIKDRGEVTWGLDAKAPGLHSVAVRAGGAETEFLKQVEVEAELLVTPVVQSQSKLQALLYPRGELLPSESPFKEIAISYPEQSYRLLGWQWHWLVLFLVVSVLAGLVGSKLLGVEI